MEKENQLYELGYHLVPTVGDDGVSPVVEAIKKKISSYEGEISRSEDPKLIDLAYAIEKRIDAKKRTFNSAYFGWMNIYMPAQGAAKLQEDLRANNSVLRFILVKKDTEETPDVSSLVPEESESDEDAVNEDEVDKAIAELVEEEA